MAKKSKSQRAKASAVRAAKKAAAEKAANEPVVEQVQEPEKKSLLDKVKKTDDKAADTKASKSSDKRKPKKKSKLQFFKDVRTEMKRVTWPSRKDVLQWTGVVIVALLFFGFFCIVLDDWIVTPILFAISSLGA